MWPAAVRGEVQVSDDFHVETTEDETVFIALTSDAITWAKGPTNPLRQLFDEKGGAFAFSLPNKKKEAEDLRSRIKEAGFKIREL